MSGITIKPNAVEFITPSFTPEELEIVNNLEFTRSIILELISKLRNLDDIEFDSNFSQLTISINSYKNLLNQYATNPPLRTGAQLLFEEILYLLQDLIYTLKLNSFNKLLISKLEQLLNANTL